MTRATERKTEELRLAKAQGWITTHDLAHQFHVSQSTILKDLNALAKAGLLQKTGFGSAACYVPTHPPDDDPPAKETTMSNAEQRKKIAIDLVTAKGWIIVYDLADECNISAKTARKTLTALVNDGVLRRRRSNVQCFYTLAVTPPDNPPAIAA